jgi:hypothetical protein
MNAGDILRFLFFLRRRKKNSFRSCNDDSIIDFAIALIAVSACVQHCRFRNNWRFIFDFDISSIYSLLTLNRVIFSSFHNAISKESRFEGFVVHISVCFASFFRVVCVSVVQRADSCFLLQQSSSRVVSACCSAVRSIETKEGGKKKNRS